MRDDTNINLRQTVAALRQELEARTAERDEALAREAALAELLQTDPEFVARRSHPGVRRYSLTGACPLRRRA